MVKSVHVHVILVSLCLLPSLALAGFPDAVIELMQGPPSLNGHSAYTAVHAETRIRDFNPQLLQKSNSVNDKTQWRSVIPELQPFRSLVDRENSLVYFRKDFFDKCPAMAGCDYYGEIFSFNDKFVYLRTETFAVFGGDIDDGKTWDIRIDKFRLASHSSQGRDHFPSGLGRIWAPIRVVNGFSKTGQTIDTLACLSLV
jgi:hypothetical protein